MPTIFSGFGIPKSGTHLEAWIRLCVLVRLHKPRFPGRLWKRYTNRNWNRNWNLRVKADISTLESHIPRARMKLRIRRIPRYSCFLISLVKMIWASWKHISIKVELEEKLSDRQLVSDRFSSGISFYERRQDIWVRGLRCIVILYI